MSCVLAFWTVSSQLFSASIAGRSASGSPCTALDAQFRIADWGFGGSRFVCFESALDESLSGVDSVTGAELPAERAE